MERKMKQAELNTKLVNRAIDWIDTKWAKKGKNCEVCGNDDWSYCADMLTVLTDQPFNTTNPLEAYPFFAIACKDCGNTKFFNAHALGLIEDDETKKD